MRPARPPRLRRDNQREPQGHLRGSPERSDERIPRYILAAARQNGEGIPGRGPSGPHEGPTRAPREPQRRARYVEDMQVFYTSGALAGMGSRIRGWVSECRDVSARAFGSDVRVRASGFGQGCSGSGVRIRMRGWGCSSVRARVVGLGSSASGWGLRVRASE